MSDLTSKQKTAKKDYLNESSLVFFPFNDGTGNAIRDLVSDVSITTDGSTHTTPHGIVTSRVTGASTGIPDTPLHKNVIMSLVGTPNTSTAFFLFAFGNITSGIVLEISGAQASVGSPLAAAITAAIAGVTLSQSCLVALTFNIITGELRSYAGVNGGAVSFQNTADASAFIPEDNFSPIIKLAFSSSFKQFMQSAYMDTPDSLPAEADLLTYLDYTYQQTLVGHKIIDPRLTTGKSQ